MTAPQQPQHCDHECVCPDFDDYNSSYDYTPCEIRICAYDTRSRPAPSPEITVSTLIGYEQGLKDGAAQAREKVLDDITKPATEENKKDGWTLNVKWLVKIKGELPSAGESICLEDIEFILLALKESLRTKEQP